MGKDCHLFTLYVMLALGLNIVIGFGRPFRFRLCCFLCSWRLSFLPYFRLSHLIENFAFFQYAFPNGFTFSSWTLLFIAAVLAGFFGLLLGFPVLRLRGDYLAIVTLGFGEIIRIFLNNLNTPINLTNGPQGIGGISPLILFELIFQKALTF